MTTTRAAGVAPWLLLAVVALIAYGSLYPFNFKADAVQGGVLAALHQLSWARAGRGDRVSNVLLYVPLGFCLYLWVQRNARGWIAATVAVGLGSLLSLSIEVAQVYISTRVPSFTDLTLNALGTVVGVLGGIAWGTLSQLVQLPRGAGAGRGDRIALVVLLLWLGWRLAPFTPHLSLLKLKEALHPLFNPQIQSGATLTYLLYWIIVAQAVFAIVSAHLGLEVLLFLIAMVLVGQLLVADQVFIAPELLALLLLLPALVLVNRLPPGPRMALLIAGLLAVMLTQSLAPYEFVPLHGSFDLWPYLAWIKAGMPVNAASLLAQLFLYGALTWLLREAGTSAYLALGIVTSLVLGIEIAQLWRPGQTGSITQPALAFGIAMVLRYVDNGIRSAAIRRHRIAASQSN